MSAALRFAGPSKVGAATRAAVLVEALPYMRRFRGATIVVKYGGAAMVAPELADGWARDVVLLEHVGMRPIVVHGGGPALTRTLERLGIESEFVDGHRVTSAEAAEVAQMVLSGRLNKEVVSRINRAGGRAIGLSGTDAAMVKVRRHRPGGRDIGFVGDVEAMDVEPLRVLMERGYVPVLSSTATDDAGQPYNVNADVVAGAVAVATSADKLVFLSDVPGVVVDGRVVSSLHATDARALLADGRASGGMMPKLQAGLDALAGGVGAVHLLDGRTPHALLLEVFTDDGVGTVLRRDDDGGQEVGP